MREQECIREDELLEALQASRWPGVDTSLREHVAGCASCTDMLAVVAPLLDERHALLQEATIPSSAPMNRKMSAAKRLAAMPKPAENVTPRTMIWPAARVASHPPTVEQ